MTESNLCFNHEAFILDGDGFEFGDVSAAAIASVEDHKVLKYLERLELFTVLNKMTAEQANKCERAWFELTLPSKARMVATLEGGTTETESRVGFNPSLAFKQVVHPNFERLTSTFSSELSSMNMTTEDLMIMLRPASLNIMSSRPVETVTYSSFLCCCYKMFYDPDKEARSRRLEKGRFLSVFRTYDVDFDRYLSPNEFRSLFKSEFPEMTEAEVRSVGRKLDIDLDSKISEREFLIWGLVGGVLDSIRGKRGQREEAKADTLYLRFRRESKAGVLGISAANLLGGETREAEEA